MALVQVWVASAEDVATLALLTEGELEAETAESLRGNCIYICRELGIWSMTKPLASLAVALTRARTVIRGAEPADTGDITIDSLGPCSKTFKGFGFFRESMSVEGQVSFCDRLKSNMQVLEDFMWSSVTEDEQVDLHATFFEAFTILQSLHLMVSQNLVIEAARLSHEEK